MRTAIGISVPERRLLGPSGEIFERGLLALGRRGAYVLPRNTPECEGLGRCPFGCPGFHKLSTDVSFLPAALRSGTRLFSGTTVERVSDTARGVRVECRLPDTPGVNPQVTIMALSLRLGALLDAELRA